MRGWSPLQRAVFALLVAVSIALGAAVYVELDRNSDAENATAPSRTATAAKSAAPAAPERFALPPFQNFAEIGERPLFAQNRQPPQAPKDAGQTSSFVLAGIVIAPTGRAVLIAHGRPPVLVHLAEGQEIEGWRVRAILPDHVVLEHGGSESELKLTDVKGPIRSPLPHP